MASNKKHDEEKQNSAEATETEKVTAAEEQAATEEKHDDKEIIDLKRQLDDMENKYLRAAAELQNVQNRAKKEQATILKYDGQKLATNILPIVDNLNRALEVKVDDKGGQQLKQGVEMVAKHLEKALSDSKVERLDVEGREFDPNFCQAVQTVPADDDHPTDHVVKVLQNGYKLADRVIRPAMVVVAK
ncbi:nucleotide exchange factor GrpE [Lactobacillus sp. Sy-1]|uniref:nucleotide exchange factor GrpE n=1 Tax=Lactobacillus sp. Sy-1 TaxID=2109645 RepID=UPI001C57BE22|nr:nucleotide exchange factor GrpE [Lactobacillus sp. Sy-1]MBW1605496.1 nucleotide exchange factor GrpE [Lactobacillus sp. Sy-1]